jgi:hypothetical protein
MESFCVDLIRTLAPFDRAREIGTYYNASPNACAALTRSKFFRISVGGNAESAANCLSNSFPLPYHS